MSRDSGCKSIGPEQGQHHESLSSDSPPRTWTDVRPRTRCPMPPDTRLTREPGNRTTTKVSSCRAKEGHVNLTSYWKLHTIKNKQDGPWSVVTTEKFLPPHKTKTSETTCSFISHQLTLPLLPLDSTKDESWFVPQTPYPTQSGRRNHRKSLIFPGLPRTPPQRV